MNKGKVSVPQGVGVLLSALLGSGVLIVPALAATQSGAYSLLAWLLMGIAILPIVFTFSALGRRYPHESGTAHYVRLAFGDSAAKSVSWLYISIAPIGPPVVFIAGAAYLSRLFGVAVENAIWLELLMLFAVFFFNSIKLETTVRVQAVISFIISGTIIGICIFALTKATPELNPPAFSVMDVGQSMAIMFWCFVGIEAICHIANDFRDPARDFPKVVIIGVVLSALVYMIVSYTVLEYGAYGSEQQNLLSVTGIAASVLGVWGEKIVALVGFAGCFCTVNIYVVSFARMLFSMSEENMVHPVFSKRHVNGTPIPAVILVVFSIAVVLLASEFLAITFDVLIDYANGVFILIYLAAALSGIKLLSGSRKTYAILSTVFCLIISFFIGYNVIYGVLVFVLSWAAYKRHEQETVSVS